MKCFILLLIPILFFNCSAQNKDCSKFKTGTFEYITQDTYLKAYSIIRNDSLQIENNSKSGFKLVGQIEWVNDCNYSLTYIDIEDPNLNHMIGVKFYVDITYTTEKTYDYIAYNDKRKIRGKMIKVKE